MCQHFVECFSRIQIIAIYDKKSIVKLITKQHYRSARSVERVLRDVWNGNSSIHITNLRFDLIAQIIHNKKNLVDRVWKRIERVFDQGFISDRNECLRSGEGEIGRASCRERV